MSITSFFTDRARRIRKNALSLAFYKSLAKDKNLWAMAAAVPGLSFGFQDRIWVPKRPTVPIDISLYDTTNIVDLSESIPKGTNELEKYYIETWLDVLERHQATMQNPNSRQIVEDFFAQFDHLRSKPLSTQLDFIDAIIDSHLAYEYDEGTYGQDDYWACPYESITKGHGDCEDYAILKFFVLKHLGHDLHRFHLLSVNNIYEENGHINLAYDTSEGGEERNLTILDNNHRRRRARNYTNTTYEQGSVLEFIANEEEMRFPENWEAVLP